MYKENCIVCHALWNDNVTKRYHYCAPKRLSTSITSLAEIKNPIPTMFNSAYLIYLR